MKIKRKIPLHIIDFNEIRDYMVIIHIDPRFNMAARSTLLVENIVRGYHIYKTEWTPESESYI